ncbi:PTS system mannose/fructose/sorbose family transporter subunit IID [Lederbergia sp. NSJ-179]|uniref:PTS system mannose/fructose/sorbose family transporter subunit IID n=1 Tax=Lederbergia sp. NSJ-179 TaxID=2931402 RepID=UPI001FD01551|nr:PTS system mannose/fructose/sorbose family transporter subunit IID [Lederbergia sp. NSJ-179]MCJ7843110.1 PTS system mannose/fructose/sorbose family transporter subunit IID [Lederbergia sp. NSJ-179]
MAEERKNTQTDIPEITKKDMRKVFWRSLFIKSTINYERFQAQGYAFAMIPVIKKLYKTTEDRAAALKRHLEMFNSHPWMANPVLGVTIVMEEQNAKGNKMEQAINNIKVGLMGPLAGIGDSLFWGTIRPILASVGATMAVQGSIVGPILFLVLWNILNFGFRYGSLVYGRKTGISFLKQMKESNIVQKIQEGASVLGLLVLGVLVASWVNISTPLKYKIGEEETAVQDVLDSILPSMLPLIATLIVIFCIKRGVSLNKILLGIFALAFLFGGTGILAGE